MKHDYCDIFLSLNEAYKKLILANVFIYVEMGDIKAEDGEDAEDDWYWFQTKFLCQQ